VKILGRHLPHRRYLLLAVLFAVAVVPSGRSADSPPEPPRRPNIILIISDDHGFHDYGFMGNAEVSTPNLDRLASESLLYTRGYVMPVCSPSLASILTGLYPSRHGITGNSLRGKPLNALAKRVAANPVLLPQALSAAGYRTMQTGKLWYQGYREAGFTDGMTESGGRHGGAGLSIGREGLQPIFDFIEASVAADRPFFVWYAPLLPHTPHDPPPDLLKKYAGKGLTPQAEKYYAMVEWLDNTCGELHRFLQEKGLDGDTMILYLADNGWDAALGSRAGTSKLTPFELGIRTPIFIRWPEKVAPLRDEETLASVVDILPTILQAAGVEEEVTLPGLDLLDRAAVTGRSTVFVEAYTHDIAELDKPEKSLVAGVVVDGWQKLIIPGGSAPDRIKFAAPTAPMLYDLKSDPLERQDLAGRQPEEVRRLSTLWHEFWSKR
jgi:uncharacterized sulfatase